MTTFGRLKKLTDLKTVPEPPENFWDTYLSNLRRRIETEPIPLFLRFRPVPLISVALTTLITLSIITTLSIYEPQVLELNNVPRIQIVEDLTEFDDIVAENFAPEDIIGEFLPKEAIYAIGGGYYEIL